MITCRPIDQSQLSQNIYANHSSILSNGNMVSNFKSVPQTAEYLDLSTGKIDVRIPETADRDINSGGFKYYYLQFKELFMVKNGSIGRMV